ncbi:hypothetical protein J6590_020713 [Homalodisca vitripennis]|nr:hypothetical protein J6590_020713 [Homalodisca vitripennis]
MAITHQLTTPSIPNEAMDDHGVLAPVQYCSSDLGCIHAASTLRVEYQCDITTFVYCLVSVNRQFFIPTAGLTGTKWICPRPLHGLHSQNSRCTLHPPKTSIWSTFAEHILSTRSQTPSFFYARMSQRHINHALPLCPAVISCCKLHHDTAPLLAQVAVNLLRVKMASRFPSFRSLTRLEPGRRRGCLMTVTETLRKRRRVRLKPPVWEISEPQLVPTFLCWSLMDVPLFLQSFVFINIPLFLKVGSVFDLSRGNRNYTRTF